jgi:O-6-methylguanine DNA methyltransferase
MDFPIGFLTGDFFMAKATFPKLKRLSKPALPDTFGVAETPVGDVLLSWQGPLLVRIHILPVGGELYLAGLFSDWGIDRKLKRDDKRATSFVQKILFPKGSWTGRFPAELEMGFFGTDFQWKIMQKMLKIPSGRTLSYGDLAMAADAPRAARAVGTICATNPLSMVVPCHRILAAGGALGGYGHGAAMKRQFLVWEE